MLINLELNVHIQLYKQNAYACGPFHTGYQTRPLHLHLIYEKKHEERTQADTFP